MAGNKTIRVGVADTTFARGDMGGLAERTLREQAAKMRKRVEVVRYTVPGIKDLPVACAKLFAEKDCEIVVALGMVGGEEIDEQCALVADIGLQIAQILEGKHVIGVFVYEREAGGNRKKLAEIMRDRTVKHCKNALELVFSASSLTKRAGTGRRQGGADADFFKL